MSAVNEILSHVPMDQLASELGTDEQTAEAAASAAAQQLLGGMAHNAESRDGESSLASALSSHATSNHLLDQDTVDLSQVDLGDSSKILSHVFGGQQDAVALSGAQQAASGSVDKDMMMKVLKFMAPIVLAYLAKNLQGGKYGDLLGGILGGGAQQQDGQSGGQRAGGGILGQILGQVLGGGRADGSQGGGGLGGALNGQRDAPPAPTTSGTTFDTPQTGDGGLTMDDGSDDPSTSQSDTGRSDTGQQQQRGGSIFDQILGGLFGKK